jgi:hypothetical protein
MRVLNRKVLYHVRHESLPNFSHYTQSKRYGKIMLSLYSKIPGFRLTYGGEPSDSFTTFEISEGSNLTYLNLEQIHEMKAALISTRYPT